MFGIENKAKSTKKKLDVDTSVAQINTRKTPYDYYEVERHHMTIMKKNT
jgi:hypothetical protein